MQSIKQFNKGEYIFKEGESIDKLVFMQSGKVSLFIERNGKKIEIEQINGAHVLGEMGLINTSKHLFSAIAMSPSKILEISIDSIKPQVEKLSPVLLLLIKSLVETAKTGRQKIKSYKMEQDDSPCPQLIIPKLFIMFSILAKHLGKITKSSEGGDEYLVSWQSLKNYTTRMFLEAPQRVQSGLELLKKLGYADLKYSKDEDNNEVLNEIIFREIQVLEDFAEFYQFHLYKPGRSEVMYVDEVAFRIIKSIVSSIYSLQADFKGAVTLEYEKLISNIKNNSGIEIKNTHWDLLEKKGLFVHRKTNEKGLTISVNQDEFIKTAIFWAIINEIDEWNTKGFIDFTIVKTNIESSLLRSCPDCNTDLKLEQKFCHNCGIKIKAA